MNRIASKMTLRYPKHCQMAVFQVQMPQNIFIFYLLCIGLFSTKILAQALIDTPPLSHHTEPNLESSHNYGKPDKIVSSPPYPSMKSAQKGAHIDPSKSSSECHSLQTVPCHDLQPIVPPLVTKSKVFALMLTFNLTIFNLQIIVVMNWTFVMIY